MYGENLLLWKFHSTCSEPSSHVRGKPTVRTHEGLELRAFLACTGKTLPD